MVLNLVAPKYLRLYQIDTLYLAQEKTITSSYYPFNLSTLDTIIISEVGYYTLNTFVINIASMFTAISALIAVILGFLSRNE